MDQVGMDVRQCQYLTIIATVGFLVVVATAQDQMPTGDEPVVMTPQVIFEQIPDPELDRAEIFKRLEIARQNNNQAERVYLTRIMDRVEAIRRESKASLTLEEVIHKTLANSYAIEVQRFNPAVEVTRLTEAKAAFDALFFTTVNHIKQDRPTGSQLITADLQQLDMEYGFRKLLPSGAQISTSYGLRRTKTSLSFQTINPEYFSKIALSLRQPLLRGYGLDYNLAFIRVSRNDHLVSKWAFRREVRDLLRDVEEAYWRLLQARRDIVITARLLADFEAIYDYLQARKSFDIMPVQLEATKANLAQTRADFVAREAAVFDAEDRLVALINDPSLNLADGVEIIPTDVPMIELMSADRLAEAQIALDHRPEIHEQKLTIANAKIQIGRAKIDELPKLDVTFNYTIDGLAGNADGSFDEVTRHKYADYFVGVEFELPIGNRGPRAARKRADLQYRQALAGLNAVIEQILLDVNVSVRALATSYDQIAPSLEAAQSRQREVDSIIARAERKDFNTLNSELSSRQQLAAARRAMLAAIVDYNIATIDLQRARGTLLEYNHVVVPGTPD